MTTIHLQTKRLIIRSPTIADAPALNAAVHASAESLRPWMPWVHPLPTVAQTTEHLRSAIEKSEKDEDYYLVVLTSDGTVVGASGTHRIEWRIPRAEIGYWIDQRHAGLGYASEATAAITDFARNTMGMRRIEIIVSDRNERSWRIPERLGYNREGILRNHRVNADGQIDHTRFYAMINDNPQPTEQWKQIQQRALISNHHSTSG